jgi:hypothetical protein
MSIPTNRRFELRRLDQMKWAIVDLTLADEDPHRMVACVYELDEFECDVFWFRELDLPLRYATPGDVLADVIRTASSLRPSAPRLPVPIPAMRFSDRLTA